MHPHSFYSSLFSVDKRNEIFVLMSFAEEFEDRWFNVIEPTIRDTLNMKAYRVDYNTSGESIIHDILDGIANSKLVLVDITSTSMRNEATHEIWPHRNANVMWELGLAHTMRLPDEVIVVKSDHEKSIFHLTQFRAFQYDPTNRKRACDFIKEIVEDRIKIVDQSKSDYVRKTLNSLSPFELRGYPGTSLFRGNDLCQLTN